MRKEISLVVKLTVIWAGIGEGQKFSGLGLERGKVRFGR